MGQGEERLMDRDGDGYFDETALEGLREEELFDRAPWRLGDFSWQRAAGETAERCHQQQASHPLPQGRPHHRERAAAVEVVPPVSFAVGLPCPA